jgi:hypothetical protein
MSCVCSAQTNELKFDKFPLNIPERHRNFTLPHDTRFVFIFYVGESQKIQGTMHNYVLILRPLAFFGVHMLRDFEFLFKVGSTA